MTKAQLKSVAASEHGITLLDSMTRTEMQVSLMQAPPFADVNDTVTVTGNVTKIVDSLPPGMADLVASVNELDTRLASLGPYVPANAPTINSWILKEIVPDFPDHSLSYGPNNLNSTYQITVSGNAVSIQWVLS